ncbi:MAG: sulfatase [Chloroflexi bacterium]|nr:MAG: sulfatase [Chloroflexota bacterium]
MTAPNVLLIILDTQRRDRLSVYGHQRDTSPALADFAARATVFERAISPAQWTVPAHASLFTGLYPSTHGLTQANGRLTDDLPTLAEILRRNNYHTVGFCNNPLVGVLDNGLQRGFNEFYNYAGAAPNRPVDIARSRARRAVAMRWRRFAHRVSQRFAHSDALFRLSLTPALVEIWTRLINYKGNTARSIDDLIAYWEHYSAGGQERPLFAFLNLMGTHLPYRPPQAYIDKINPKLKHDKHAYRFMARFNADAARWASPTDPPLTEWERAVLDDFYDAEIAHQDYHVGRLLDYLKRSGALENTLVLIAADHGEGHGDHGFVGHSFVVYQELVHVPLIAYHPDRFPDGHTVETNISTRRLFHTVLDITGVPAPTTRGDVHTLSLAHTATTDETDSEGGVAFAEAIPPKTFLSVLEYRNPTLIERLALTQVRRGVYDGEHKLAMVGGQVEGLFDVSHDPQEVRDMSHEQPSTVAALQQKLQTFVATAESQRAVVGELTVSQEVEDNLRALGYFE